MSNIVIPNNFGTVSTRFAAHKSEDDLSAGVSSGFGIISYRGKVWRTKFRGEEISLMREDGDGPRASIEVVILRLQIISPRSFTVMGIRKAQLRVLTASRRMA